MSERLQFDLVAIRGGFAGLYAALRGAELGLRTAIVEAGADDGNLCSSCWARGIFHVSYHDVKLSPDELIAAINRQTGGEADPELAAAIAADCARTVDWLAGQGAEFVPASPISWHRLTLGPPRSAVAGQDWQGRGPDQMLGELRHRLEQHQGRMFLGTRAVGLRIKRGRCVGIAVRRGDERFEIDARAIVIADGGFPGNAELLHEHISPQPDRVLMRHAGTAIGDGLEMAEAAGAATIGFNRFYGHLLSRDAMDNPGLWPYLQIDAVETAAIVVDPTGKRLLDEGLGGISIINDLACLDDPLCATLICDAPIWETAGRAAQIPPNPQLIAGGGTLHQAETLADLADAAGLSRAGLAKTVAGYNDAVRDGRLTALFPARSTRIGQPRAIETSPFCAIPIYAGIPNTGHHQIGMPGRLRGDRQASVLRRLR